MSRESGVADSAGSRRARNLLALGAAAGLIAAAWGLLQSPQSADPLPSDAVAIVNGTPIRLDAFRRAVAAVAAERRNPMDTEQRRHVLSRLIEEELLVQRGVELGLLRHDRRVRGDLVAAVIDSVVSVATAGEASDTELEAFHVQNADYFARPGRLRVRALRVRPREGESEAAARARGERAAARVRSGEAIGTVDAELGDPQVAPLPDVLLPPIKIREYLGPTALRHLLELEAGEVSDPLATPGGVWVLQVVEREPSRTLPFDELRAEVRAEWRRREGDRALRAYLDDLRDQGNVHVREPLP